MDIEEWRELAAKEEEHHLHDFNYRRERQYKAGSLEQAYGDFAAFLEDKRIEDSWSADALLKAFVKENLEKKGRAAVDDPRFIDPGLRTDSRQVFLRSLGSREDCVTHIGFNPANIRFVSAEISAAISRLPLDDNLERELQTMVEGLRPPADVREDDEDQAEALALLAVAGASTIDGAATDFGADPWWFTYEDALLDEEAKLPKMDSPLERSGYVAGLRAGLGLHNDRDSWTEAQTGPHGMPYRIYYQLATTTPANLSSTLNQPRLFSGGTPYLFLTNPKTPSGGLTVRLEEVGCSHAIEKACACAKDGLPEGVVPAYVPMNADTEREVRGLYLVFHRDLSRYAPPSCDAIRALRASA